MHFSVIYREMIQQLMGVLNLSPLFFAVDGDYTVAPLPRFISAEKPARYDPVTQGEHIARELERSNGYRQAASSESSLTKSI